ncbi:YihA family ribosome biogenesis GTP-binding protein, partial [candidate division KSB1 bacterium]
YLANNSFLIGAVQILDSRLELTDNDLVMLRWLRHYQIPTIIIATKADKLSQNQLVSQLERLNRALSVQGFPEAIPFSAKTKLGQHQLWKAIQRLLKSEDNREKS